LKYLFKCTLHLDREVCILSYNNKKLLAVSAVVVVAIPLGTSE
jgi:hypothetical protein